MADMTQSAEKAPGRHSSWVRATHWIITLSFLILAYTGVMILMVHPRLYWGEAGNDLVDPWIEIPISRNYQHGGWKDQTAFQGLDNSVLSASRTYEIFNQNSWGRSLHFLAGWVLVLIGLIYLLSGILTNHFRRNFIPHRTELGPGPYWREIKDHLRMRIRPATGGPDYGVLQKTSYLAIVFLILPLMFLTGITMSPAVTSSFPFLLDVFGGHQSARTIHFIAFAGLLTFMIVHIVMVVKSGFRTQMRSMTLGRKHE
jgi:thiosulfate reductase cytochrome b subunit